MTEEKDISSSSPVKTPKLQLAPEQPPTGECWIPPKKDTLCPRAKEKPQQDGRRGTIMFKIKSQICQRCSEGTKKPLCIPQVREGSSDPYKRLSQTCLWVFEVLLWRHRSAVTCRQGRGSGCCRPGRFGMGHESLWRRPLLPHIIEPLSRQPTNWRTRIPKKFSHCYKNSRAHNRFPNLGIQKKDWNPPPRETDSSRAQLNLMCTRTQEKGAVTPQETEPNSPLNIWESLVEVWVNSGLPRGKRHWLQQSWELWYGGISPFEGGPHDHQYPYHSLA